MRYTNYFLITLINILIFLSCSDYTPTNQEKISAQQLEETKIKKEMAERSPINLSNDFEIWYDNEQIQSALKSVDVTLNPGKLVKLKTEALRSEIRRLEAALNTTEIQENKKVHIYVTGLIAANYSRLANQLQGEEVNFNLEKSLEYETKSIELLKSNQPKFRPELAYSYLRLANIYSDISRFDKAKEIMVMLTENYQNLGIGPYESWFSSQYVNYILGFALKGSSSSESKQKNTAEALAYINTISTQYDNGVGARAALSLYSYYSRAGLKEKANEKYLRFKNVVNELNNEHLDQRLETLERRREQHSENHHQ